MSLRIYILALCCATGLAVCQQACALNLKFKKEQKPPVNYTEWIAIQDLPETENGKKIFYPTTDSADGSAEIKGLIAVPGLDAEQAFLAAMVYAVDNLSAEAEECMMSVDYDRHEFTVLQKSTQGTNSKETTYTRCLTVTGAKGAIEFKVSDIAVRYREKGLIPRTLPFAGLHPESNTRHGELVMELVAVNSEYINDMAAYAALRKDIRISNASAVKSRTMVTGLNHDEVKLILGAPMEVRRSGDKIRWIYPDNAVVIFTEGKVSRIIQ